MIFRGKCSTSKHVECSLLTYSYYFLILHFSVCCGIVVSLSCYTSNYNSSNIFWHIEVLPSLIQCSTTNNVCSKNITQINLSLHSYKLSDWLFICLVCPANDHEIEDIHPPWYISYRIKLKYYCLMPWNADPHDFLHSIYKDNTEDTAWETHFHVRKMSGTFGKILQIRDCSTILYFI